MRALFAIAALVLAGCTKPIPPPEYVPPLLLCDARCDTPCDTGPPPAWNPPDPRSPAAFDLIRPQVVVPLRARVQQCEEHRKSCVACLDEADRQGIIVRQQR